MSEEKINETSTTQTAPTTTAVVKAKSFETKDLLIPISIVLAGLFVGAGLYLSGGNGSTVKAPQGVTDNPTPQVAADTTDKIDPVTEKDHIFGSINAPVKIVEYSDFECPFCKKNHESLKAITAKYGAKVAWVYRQFPIEQLHSKAPKVAMASECVAELGGNDAFWKFANGYFDVTLSNNRTDIDTVLPALVSKIGINKTAFDDCVASGRHQDVIDANMADATETGGQGTPWVILIGADGKTSSINGAQPPAVIEKAIDTALGTAK